MVNYMHREQLISLARQVSEGGMPLAIFTITELERFAALVAAAEREECAKVCDDWSDWHGGAEIIAKAIRARSCN
jgi:hypothetical protein